MPSSLPDYEAFLASPLNLLSEIFAQFEWTYSYPNEHEVEAEIKGRWDTYRLFGFWREDAECLLISTLIDLKIPSPKRSFIEALLSSINPKVYLGHFEIVPDENILAFRYTLTLRGNPTATLEQLEEIVFSALSECDRLYPALQFILWEGKNPQDAVIASIMETFGEA